MEYDTSIMKTVAIDIDGTLRDLDVSLEKYLEIDHPTRLDTFVNSTEHWDALDRAFDGDREAVVNWLYGQRAFQTFGQAPKMYRDVIDHLNALDKRARINGDVRIVISSVQQEQSITATLFWLSKMGCRVHDIKFYDSFEEKMNDHYDFVVDDHPQVLEAAKANGSTPVVVPHPYNEHLKEKDGFRRLDYEGEKPTGLAGLVDLLNLGTYQIVEGD